MPTAGGREADRLEAESDDLRNLAAIQVLRPTATQGLWELLGSADGAEWEPLGTFELLGAETLQPRQGVGLDFPASGRAVSGVLRLYSQEEPRFVASHLAGVPSDTLLRGDALLFRVLEVTRDPENAVRRAAVLSRLVSSTGRAGAYRESAAPMSWSERGEAAPETQSGCASGCSWARDQKIDLCSSSYGACLGTISAGLSVCLIACGGATPACTACVASYALGLWHCDHQHGICVQAAWVDYSACLTSCPGGGGGGDPDPFFQDPDCGELCCPVVIDLDGRGGFRFTSPQEGVSFDLDGNGATNRTAWTEPGQGQAFLAMDRNQNGTIDDGTELFGAVTPQPPASDPNGFRALAVFDEPGFGGNADGKINADDAVFDLLYLWKDENHDGVSQPEELSLLREAGVEYVSLDYVTSSRRDRHGNLLRFKTLVKKTDRMVQAVDVFFAQVEP